MKAITDAAFANYPQQPFEVIFGAANVSVDVSMQGANSEMTEDPLQMGEPSTDDPEQLFPAIEYMHGRAVKGTVTTIYNNVCNGRNPIRFTSGQTQRNPISGQIIDLTSNGNMSVFIRAAGSDQAGGGRHMNYGERHLDGIHWDLKPGGGGCHGKHQHYQWTKENVHSLETDTLPREVLGFELPDSEENIRAPRGAHGAWGQPVTPVMFTLKRDPKKDPFNLKVGFKFSSNGGGSRFNMQKSETMLAPAAAIAYYHRRGHLGEPPNLLNPFWHATLAPIEIDERQQTSGGKKYDPTELSQESGLRMNDLIKAAFPDPSDQKDAAAAYKGLKDEIPGMSLPAGGR
jgi:hypothetical protein